MAGGGFTCMIKGEDGYFVNRFEVINHWNDGTNGRMTITETGRDSATLTF
jgi:hypothetical protein